MNLRTLPSNDRYLVSDCGRVFSRYRKYHLSPKMDRKLIEMSTPRDSGGYPVVRITKDGKGKTIRVHNLVMETWGSWPRPVGMECRHWDGDPTNNRSDNLLWGTTAQNAADRMRHGTVEKGTDKWNAKLSPEKVREIRWLDKCGYTVKEIAKKFDVSTGTISPVLSGKTWRHVT